MRAIFGAVILTASTFFLTGCGTLGNFQSIHREFDLDPTKGDVKSHFIDVQQRAVFVARDRRNHSPAGSIVCAEPSPDALTVYGATLAASGNAPSGVGASLQAGTQEGGTLMPHGNGTQVLRDSFYRICEGYLAGGSGGTGRWAYHIMLNRLATNTIGYLAVEQLTDAAGAAKSSPTNLTVNSSADSLKLSTSKDGSSDDPSNKKDPKANKGDKKQSGTGGQQASAFPALPGPRLISADYAAPIADHQQNGAAAQPPAATAPAGQTSGQHGGANAGGAQKTKIPPKEQQDPTASKAPKDSLSDVSHDVRKIVQDIIGSDQSLPLCFAYFADTTEPEDQSDRDPVDTGFCQQIMSTAQKKSAISVTVSELNVDKVSAYRDNCLSPSTYGKNKDFCTALLATMPADEFLPKIKKTAASNNKNTGQENEAAPNANDDDQPGVDAAQGVSNPTM